MLSWCWPCVWLLSTGTSVLKTGLQSRQQYVQRTASYTLNLAADHRQVIALPQLISIIVATAKGGFGESYTLLSSDDTQIIAKVRSGVNHSQSQTDHDQSLRAGDVFFLLALFVGKCTSIWLCRRLFAVGQHRNHLYCEVAIGACGLWCLGSIIAVVAGCSATDVIRAGTGKCSGLVSLNSRMVMQRTPLTQHRSLAGSLSAHSMLC